MRWETFPADELLAARVGHVVTSIAYGAILAGIIVLLWGRFRGGSPFPDAPGHWLLLFLTAGVFLDAVAEAASRSLLPVLQIPAGWHSWYRWHTQQAVLLGGVAILSAGFLAWMRARRGWALLFLIMLVASLAVLSLQAGLWKARSMAQIETFGRARHLVELVSAIAVLVTTSVVALIDRRRNPGRDWLHCTGVAVFVVLSACYIAQRLQWLV
jgi:hypothetical protein